MNIFLLSIAIMLFLTAAKKYGFRKFLTVVILFVAFIGGGIIAWAFASGNFG